MSTNKSRTKSRKSKLSEWAATEIEETKNRRSGKIIEESMKNLSNNEKTSHVKDIKESDHKKSILKNHQESINTIDQSISNKKSTIKFANNEALIKRDKEVEFLLKDETNRFVLFPIR